MLSLDVDASAEKIGEAALPRRGLKGGGQSVKLCGSILGGCSAYVRIVCRTKSTVTTRVVPRRRGRCSDHLGQIQRCSVCVVVEKSRVRDREWVARSKKDLLTDLLLCFSSSEDNTSHRPDFLLRLWPGRPVRYQT